MRTLLNPSRINVTPGRNRMIMCVASTVSYLSKIIVVNMNFFIFQQFEDIECEWPILYLYLALEGICGVLSEMEYIERR